MNFNTLGSISIWLNTQEAAEFLKIHKGTLRNLVSNGVIPYYKFGRSNRYLQCELEQMLKSNPKGERLWELNTMNIKIHGKHTSL